MNFIFVLCAMFIAPNIFAPQITETDFEQVIINYDAWSDNLNNPEFYKEFSWKDGEKLIKFTELSEFDKDQFYIVQMHKISSEMYTIKYLWELDMNKMSIPASKVSEHLLKLQKIRTKTATKVEDLIVKIFEKNKDKIPEKEMSFMLRRLKAWHRMQGLIIDEKK